MIFIISESNDLLTLHVINYLNKIKATFVRIDLDIHYVGFDFCLNYLPTSIITIIYNNSLYKLKSHDSVWFRRGNISSYLHLNNNSHFKYREYIASEKKALETFLYNYLNKNCFVLGNPLRFDCSKLEVLYNALICQLKIPLTFLTFSRESLIRSGLQQFASKPIGDILFQAIGHKMHHTFVEKYDIEHLNDFFGNSLFQEVVHAVAEVRVLSITDKIYSSHLLINENRKHLDMRHFSNLTYKYNKIDISLTIKNKIIQLNHLMESNFSIIDFLVDENGNYFLIDYNMCGQYDEIRDLYPTEIDCTISTILYTNDKNK